MQRIHGKGAHIGKKPNGNTNTQNKLEMLKEQLEKAVSEQDFESAVKIRDEINLILMAGGEQ